MSEKFLTKSITYDNFKKEVLNDYRTILVSREASLIGRKEVLSGKAKFGIFGDGKNFRRLLWLKYLKKVILDQDITEIKHLCLQLIN